MKFYIPNMSCGGCARGVTRAIQNVDANAKVNVDLESKWVDVDSSAQTNSLAAALTAADFPPQDQA